MHNGRKIDAGIIFSEFVSDFVTTGKSYPFSRSKGAYSDSGIKIPLKFLKTLSGMELNTEMTDNLKVKANKAVDDARVAAHAVYDDAAVATHNALKGAGETVQKVSDDAKIGANKAVADAKIAAHKAGSELKKEY